MSAGEQDDIRTRKTAPKTAPERPQSARIGIFRRVAVERYVRPLESDTPEMLAPLNRSLLVIALVLTGVAYALLTLL